MASSNSNDPLTRRGGLTDRPAGSLDRPLARGGALLVGLERDRFISAEAPVESPGNADFVACLDQEAAVIKKMQEDGLVDEGRAALFISRAEARCRAQNPDP